MAISDKPMTYKEFRAIKALLTTELQLTPKEWLRVLGPTLDSTGAHQNMLDTSGQVTEANSAGLKTDTTYLRAYTAQATNPSFGAIATSTGYADQKHRRLFQTSVTATAGGEITATNIGPPTLAGYQACMLITHIWSDQTDASIALTFDASAGAFTTGLTTWTIATTAGLVVDYGQGLAWEANTDAATIRVACAAGQAGNAQTLTFCGVYWYET